MSNKDFSVVGKSVKRTDTLEKVTGAGLYAGDINLPGMLYGKMKRSNIAHANIKSIDVSKALALAGVKAVLTYKNVPRVLHSGSPHPRSASVTKDQYIFDKKVRFWGDGVAAVAAISEEIAEQAVELIEVEYEELPAVFNVADATAPGAPQIHDNGLDDNLALPPVIVKRGNIEKGFAEADLILEGKFDLGRPVPGYMEPNVCTCDWDGNGKLTMWTSTQSAFMVRGTLAEVLDLPLNQIRVLVHHMGGGFGGKQDIYQHEFLCALLSKETGRPMRMELSREECFLGGRTRHGGYIKLKQGFKKDGTITARQAEVRFDTGGYGSHAPGVTTVGTTAMTSLYQCENVSLDGRGHYTNGPIAGAFRGYGVVQSYFALDLQVDEAAAALGFDPAEFKLKNAVRAGDIAPSGHPVKGNGLPDCIKRAMEEVNWTVVRAEKPELPAHLRRGWGIGCEMHGSSAYPGIMEQGNAIIRVNEDGSVCLITGSGGLGTGAHTALSQIVAEELGVPFEMISFVQGDTDVCPWDIGAFASHTTYMVGMAGKIAAADCKKQIFTHVAPRLEVNPEELNIVDGRVVVNDGSDRGFSLAQAVTSQQGMPAIQIVGVGSYSPAKSYSFSAHAVEVEVDIETGKVTVLQVVAVTEVGKVIHPIAAQGQVEGGIQQAIGHTLSEDYVIDPGNGRPLNAGLVDYKMPLSMDMPPIRTIILETAPDSTGPYGAKGIGEDPIIPTGPAILNALYDAVGVRYRCYPVTPEVILDGLREIPAQADYKEAI